MKKFVSYLRVSTTRQGASGLGLEGQREAVTAFALSNQAEIVAEFIEVESGARRDRPELARAIQCAKAHRAVLLIAKMDRLARSVNLISGLMESNVEFIAADNPHASRLMIHLLAAFAEHERSEISSRTKAALAAAKARGVVLGKQGRLLGKQATEAARELYDAHKMAITEACAQAANLREAAAGLNTRGVPTREPGSWGPSTTARLLRRLGVTLGELS